jgi:hypothetical protein
LLQIVIDRINAFPCVFEQKKEDWFLIFFMPCLRVGKVRTNWDENIARELGPEIQILHPNRNACDTKSFLPERAVGLDRERVIHPKLLVFTLSKACFLA